MLSFQSLYHMYKAYQLKISVNVSGSVALSWLDTDSSMRKQGLEPSEGNVRLLAADCTQQRIIGLR
jgi:hypothetical protein